MYCEGGETGDENGDDELDDADGNETFGVEGDVLPSGSTVGRVFGVCHRILVGWAIGMTSVVGLVGLAIANSRLKRRLHRIYDACRYLTMRTEVRGMLNSLHNYCPDAPKKRKRGEKHIRNP